MIFDRAPIGLSACFWSTRHDLSVSLPVRVRRIRDLAVVSRLVCGGLLCFPFPHRGCFIALYRSATFSFDGMTDLKHSMSCIMFTNSLRPGNLLGIFLPLFDTNIHAHTRACASGKGWEKKLKQ